MGLKPLYRLSNDVQPCYSHAVKVPEGTNSVGYYIVPRRLAMTYLGTPNVAIFGQRVKVILEI